MGRDVGFCGVGFRSRLRFAPTDYGGQARDTMHLWNSRQPVPDAARESRIAVGGASAVVDVAYLLEFRKGQRRVCRPECVGVFVDRAIDKKLPVPGSGAADVLDVEPDVRSAIAQELVIPLRSPVEQLGALDVIEEKGSGPFRGRRNQVIDVANEQGAEVSPASFGRRVATDNKLLGLGNFE